MDYRRIYEYSQKFAKSMFLSRKPGDMAGQVMNLLQTQGFSDKVKYNSYCSMDTGYPVLFVEFECPDFKESYAICGKQDILKLATLDDVDDVFEVKAGCFEATSPKPQVKKKRKRIQRNKKI